MSTQTDTAAATAAADLLHANEPSLPRRRPLSPAYLRFASLMPSVALALFF